MYIIFLLICNNSFYRQMHVNKHTNKNLKEQIYIIADVCIMEHICLLIRLKQV